MSGSLGELHRHSNGTRVDAPESTSAVSLRVLGLPGGPNATSSFRVSGSIDLGARAGPALTACIGVTTRGVRAVTPDALGARRAARERDDGGPSNVAQAYRPIGTKNRFQSCRRLRCGGPLDRTVWRRGIESERSVLCALDGAPAARRGRGGSVPARSCSERGQLPKDDG